jgi:hypothetical protein
MTDPAQINYSVIVSEELSKQAEVDNEVALAEGFVSAKTVPLVHDAPSPSLKAEVPLHPMFRGGSSSSRSRSASLVPETRPRKSGRSRVKVEEDIIEILSSDEELDEPSPQPAAAVGEDEES